MLIIGLTGGIGSGKTTVSKYFEKLGVPIIDADQLTRELVAPGQPALNEIAGQLGTDLLTADGELNRPRLRERIFTHPRQRQVLEAILHPRTREAALQQLTALRESTHPPAYVILSVPLLIESGWTNLVDRVLVIDTSPAQQQQRASQRDGLDNAHINAVIRSQIDRETRLAAADDVIHNDTDLPALQAQVAALHQQYQQLAHPR
ncbi:MAG TPA: dephospho-CoA kinase [Gammaproteobacteria bacterium]|nr:dephospho-CoA kinase [Gammaproteobacteria bacterium]